MTVGPSFLKAVVTRFSINFSENSGDGCQVHSLHQSQFVYRCDVFSHSAPAASSLPFQDCVPLSSMQEPAVRLTKKTAQSLSQYRFQHLDPSSQSDPSREKRNDLPTRQPPCQLMPVMELQDLSYIADYLQPSNFNNGEQPTSEFDNVDWFDPKLGLYPGDQHQALPFSLPELLNNDDRSHVEEPPSQSHIQGNAPEDGCDIQIPQIKCSQLDLQDLPKQSNPQRLFGSHAIPLPSDSHPQLYTFPPTPPPSTRSEGASPTGDLGESHQHVLGHALQVRTDQLITRQNGLSTSNEETMILPPPQYPSPEITWSDEDFARFLDSDPFLTNLNSLDHGSIEQSMLSSGSQYQSPSSAQSNSQPHDQHQQRDWHSLTSNPSIYSNHHPTFPLDVFQQANTSTDPVGAMPNYSFSFTNQSLPTAAPTTMSSLFDDLSSDVDPPTARRRSGAKAPQRASAKDRQLIEWKNQGLSYKEIKARGGFEAAESTLRGGYRTLTKPKHLRVRKPEWPEKDVRSSVNHGKHG